MCGSQAVIERLPPSFPQTSLSFFSSINIPLLLHFFPHHRLLLPPFFFLANHSHKISNMEFASLFNYFFLSSIFFIFLFHSLTKFFNSSRRSLPLPPGSLGWPYIGETFQLYSQNPNVFFTAKQQRSVH